MDTPKFENLLNLAIEATPQEREKSLQLGVGFDPQEQSWELIVKYSGDIQQLANYSGIRVQELLNEYAILEVPESLLPILADTPEIEYVEKPKRLYFAVDQGIRSSCLLPIYQPPYDLSGQGVIMAFLDSGIDYRHPDFRNEDGSTRILGLWDQTLNREFTSEEINQALLAATREEGDTLVPSRDLSGHGTHVAGIGAGNGRASQGRYRGAAYESPLLVVKLGTPRTENFPRTTELMTGLDYVVKKALEYQLPVAVNISFGNTYGSHSGTSLLERFIDDIANYWKSVIVIGTGNEGSGRGHTAGRVIQGETTRVQLAVGTYQSTLNLQLWKSYVDEYDLELVHPSGRRAGPFAAVLGPQRFALENTELLLYYGEPRPYSSAQEVYLEFLPTADYIDSGIWEIHLIPRRIVQGDYNMWLPSQAVLGESTGFLYPVESTTLTIPSTAAKAIAVGAYDARYRQVAEFSGRGYTRELRQIKPDLVAPGVAITAPAPGGGYATRSGTSMAAPFVAGSAALLMQWGIVQGRDPYLYGEKVKAYLLRGARPLEGIGAYPDPRVGWGSLCVRDSLPS